MDSSRFHLRSQKALVTGASSGIGRAVAVAFGRAGADVVVNCLTSPAAAESVVAEIAGHGGRSFAHQADVSEEHRVKRMFDRMRDEFGTIDILVANAGLQQDAPIGEMSLAQWNKVLSVNLTGVPVCAGSHP
jgi:glucose 1-dehydrogenase